MAHASFETISLVITVDDTCTQVDDAVWKITRELGQASIRAQVILLDPNNVTANQKQTYWPRPIVVDSMAKAIQETQFATVAIVDSHVLPTACQWQELRSLDPEMVRVWAQYDAQVSWSKTFWAWWLGFLTQWHLGTRKHGLSKGITVFRRNQIKHHTKQLTGCSTETDLLRLLTCTKLQGQHATELITYDGSQASSNCHHGSREYLRRIASVFKIWFNDVMFPVHHANVQRPRPRRRSSRIAKVLGVILLAVVLLCGALNYPLFEPDESRNSQIAHNILATGNWASMTLRGEPYLDKPPLFHWCVALSYSVFGETPWATRLPVAIASMITLVLCLTVGRRLFGFWAAWYGSVCLLLTTGFLLVSRYSTMDSLLTMSVIGTFLFGLRSIPGIAGRTTFSRRPAICCSIFVGLGLLAKGPLVLLFTLPPLLLAASVFKPIRQPLEAKLRKRLNRRKWTSYLLPALIVAGPWYLWTLMSQPEFLTHFFWKHNVMRFASGFNHQQPFYFYLIGIFLFMFPVSYLLIPMFRFATSTRGKYSRYRSREFGAIGMFVIWSFVFLSLSTTKLATYLAPTFPMICLMIGVFLEQTVFRSGGFASNMVKSMIWRAPAELLIWVVGLSIAGALMFDLTSLQVATLIGSCLLFALLCWMGNRLATSNRGKSYQWWGVGGMAAVIALMVSNILFPLIAQQRSDQLAIQQHLESNPQPLVFVARDPFLATCDIGSNHLVYFSKTELTEASEYLRQHPESLLVTSTQRAEQLQSNLDHVTITKQARGRHVFQVAPSKIDNGIRIAGGQTHH